MHSGRVGANVAMKRRVEQEVYCEKAAGESEWTIGRLSVGIGDDVWRAREAFLKAGVVV